MAFDRLLFARLLFSLVTLGYGVVTIKADFNKTHATNPLWTGHARFHLVWQITSYLGFALLAFALIWLPGPYPLERLYLAGSFAGVVYGAFFLALLSMPLYGGCTFDDNGYQPFQALGLTLDANVTVFSALTVLLLLAGIALA
jgi:hypothetical protein